MIIEVEVKYSEHDKDWEVNVWDVEDNERVEDLERVFPQEDDAKEYVESLVKNRKYIVHHI